MSTTKRIKQEKQKGGSKADESADSLSGDAKDKKQVNTRHSNPNRSSQHSTKSDTNKPINPKTERSSQSERDAIRERLKNRKKDITDTDSLPSPNQKSEVHPNNNPKKPKKVSKDNKGKSNDPPPLDLPKVSLNVIRKINQRQPKNETDSTITNPPQTKQKSEPKIKSKPKKVKTVKPKPNSNQLEKTDEILQKPKKRPNLIQKSINKNDDSSVNSSLNSTKIDEDKLINDKYANNSRNSVRKPVHTKKNPNNNLPDKSNENVSSAQQTTQKTEEESSSTPPKPTYRLSRNKLPQIPSDEDERIDSTSDEEPVIIPPSVDKPSTEVQPEVPQIDNQETVKSVDNNNDNQLSNNIDNQTTTLHSNHGNITQTLSSNPNNNTQSSNSNTNNATTTLNSNTTNSKPDNISSIVDDNFVKNVKEQFSESSSQQQIINESKPSDDIKASIEKVVQSSESFGEEEEEEEASDEEEEEEEEEAESNEDMSTDQDNKSGSHSHKSDTHSHKSDAHSHKSDAHSNKNSARENSDDSNPKKLSPIQEKHKSAENKQDTLSLTDIFKEVSIHSDDKNDDEPKRRRKSDPFFQMKDVNQISGGGGNKNEKNNQQSIEENRPLRNQSMRIKKKATTTNNIPLAFPHFNPKPVSFRFPSYNKNQFPINDDEFHDFEPTSKRKPDLSPPINFQIQIIPNPPIIDINSELAQYDRVKLLQEIKKQ